MLHTLEVLEGASSEQVLESLGAFDRGIAAKPEFHFTVRNFLQFLWMLVKGLSLHLACRILLLPLWRLLPGQRPPASGPLSVPDAAVPRSARGLFAYYAQPDPKPAQFACFATPGKNTFKAFVGAVDTWAAAAKRTGGVTYLLNLPVPGSGPVLEGTLPTAREALSIEARYRGVASPPGAPPPAGAPWHIKNCVMVSVRELLSVAARRNARAELLLLLAPSSPRHSAP